MFTLTAAYAQAEHNHAPQPLDGDTPVQVGANQPGSGNSTGGQASSQWSPGQQSAGQQSTPSQDSPNVVLVPVDPVAPAWPGSGGGNTQQSSGSH